MSRIAHAFFRLIESQIDKQQFDAPIFSNNISAYVSSALACVEPSPRALSLAASVRETASQLSAAAEQNNRGSALKTRLIGLVEDLKLEIDRCPLAKDKILSA